MSNDPLTVLLPAPSCQPLLAVKYLIKFSTTLPKASSSLVEGDEDCIGPSRKLLTLCQTPKNNAAHARHNSINV